MIAIDCSIIMHYLLKAVSRISIEIADKINLNITMYAHGLINNALIIKLKSKQSSIISTTFLVYVH